METAFVAALAVIVGTVVAGGMQYINYRITRHDRRYQTAVDALATLLGATADCQNQQYLAQAIRDHGLNETLEILKARYEAHAAVTRTLVAVQLSNSDQRILRLADDLVTATFALDDAADHAPELRATAVESHKALRDAAAHHIHSHARVALFPFRGGH